MANRSYTNDISTVGVGFLEAHADRIADVLGHRPTNAVHLGHGRNSRAYRLDLEDGTSVVAKAYPPPALQGRDRLGTEFRALKLMERHGMDCVPRPLHAMVEDNLALYSHIPGEPVKEVAQGDIEGLVDFLCGLDELYVAGEGNGLPRASEACFSLDELGENIVGRLGRLELEPELDVDREMLAFVSEYLRPFFEDAIETARGKLEADGSAYLAELPEEYRTLSPSDFGFHNSVRRPDGSLAFVDFEYFGPDDPAKLVNDFHLHPAMALGLELHDLFDYTMLGRFDREPGFVRRVGLLRPLYGVKWCLILLNEFVAHDCKRRAFSGCVDDMTRARERQLAKARAKLEEIRNTHVPTF